jgi:hypothetical protein
MLWIFILIIVAAVLLYIMILRPWFKTMPSLSAPFAAEASTVEKIQARITGWKTKITARLTMIAGILVGLYDQVLPYITGQDWTPLTAKVPAWALPVGMVAAGIVFDWLRRITANPPTVITQKVAGIPDPVVVAVQQAPKV